MHALKHLLLVKTADFNVHKHGFFPEGDKISFLYMRGNETYTSLYFAKLYLSLLLNFSSVYCKESVYFLDEDFATLLPLSSPCMIVVVLPRVHLLS